MEQCPVAAMALQSIQRETGCESPDQRIPGFLGDHTGSRNGRATTVAGDKGLLSTDPEAKRQISIHQNQIRDLRQTLQCPQHGPFRCSADPGVINLSGGGLTQCPGKAVTLDQGHEMLPTFGRELLAVRQSSPQEFLRLLRPENHRGRENRSKQTATANLINPSNA